MKKRSTATIGAVILGVILLGLLISQIPPWSPLGLFGGEQVCSGAYEVGSGNWIITTNVMCENENFPVNGNVTIQPGGNLTLSNTTLRMDVSVGENREIRVTTGSSGLTLIHATIKSENARQYIFKVFSKLRVYDSTIQDMGRQGAGSIEGLFLQTSDVVIKASTIKNSEAGLIVDNDGIATESLTLNTFEFDAIRILDGNNTSFQNCTITGATSDDIEVTADSTDDTIELRACSFNPSRINVQSTTSKVNVEWFTDVYVNDTNGTPVSNAFVNVTDKNNRTVFTGYTGQNGYLRGNYVIEKTINSVGSTVYNPILFSAIQNNIPGNWLAIVTTNRLVVLQLGSTGGGDQG